MAQTTVIDLVRGNKAFSKAMPLTLNTKSVLFSMLSPMDKAKCFRGHAWIFQNLMLLIEASQYDALKNVLASLEMEASKEGPIAMAARFGVHGSYWQVDHFRVTPVTRVAAQKGALGLEVWKGKEDSFFTQTQTLSVGVITQSRIAEPRMRERNIYSNTLWA